MMTGKPYLSVKSLTSSNFSTAPSVPGTTGTLAAIATFRAETLSPRPSITSGEGPTNYPRAHLLARSVMARGSRGRKCNDRAAAPADQGNRGTHDQTSLLDVACELGVLGQETISFRRVSIQSESRPRRPEVRSCLLLGGARRGRGSTDQGGSSGRRAPTRS